MKVFCGKKDYALALGAESAGIFAVYRNGDIFVSENFGDLLEENNFLKYKKAVSSYLKKEGFKPDVILTDLHPLFKTTIFGEELAKKYKARHIKVQHHIAHIFSAAGDQFCHPELVSGSINYGFRNKFGMTNSYKIPNTFFGIAMDGTGYGLDENIWGGEVFKIKDQRSKIKKIERIGSLEEQIMIGGDLAVREPARMLVAILAKLKAQNSKLKTTTQNSKIIKSKKDIYKFVKKFYTWNEFELLYNQLEQGFNCQKTTSTGRVLDAVSVLLGFAGNERKYKHEAVKKLEKNSTKPYLLKPTIIHSVIASDPPAGGARGNPAASAISSGLLPAYRQAGVASAPRNDKQWILQTTSLFEYLLKNIHKDKKRLAATAQLYIAKGLYQIVKNNPNTKYKIPNTIFAAGGMANNKIISEYLMNQGVYLSKKIPRGDEGIAVGQIYYLLENVQKAK